MMINSIIHAEGGKLTDINLTEMIYLHICDFFYLNRSFLRQIDCAESTGAI